MLSVKDSRISPSNRMPGEYKARGIEAVENLHREHTVNSRKSHGKEWGKVYDAEEDYTAIDGGSIDGTIDWMQRNRNSQS